MADGECELSGAKRRANAFTVDAQSGDEGIA